MVVGVLFAALLATPGAQAAGALAPLDTGAATTDGASGGAARQAASTDKATDDGNPKIEDKIEAQFAAQPQARQDFWVTFDDDADLSAAAKVDDWAQRGQQVVAALQTTASASQRDTIAALKADGISYRSFWVSNALLVEGATAATAAELAARPEVKKVLAPTVYATPEPVDQQPADNAPAAVEWGVANIKAPEVWQAGITGTGIVVADLDTGVDFRHPALVDRYRGNNSDGTFTHDYNWFDASGTCTDEPCDRNGHGSHVMGTMVGDDGAGNQIGVAPGARWIAANGCDPCTSTNLLAAGQWLLAPTKLDGSAPDPAKRPNIINNSWGSTVPVIDPWFEDLATAWDAAGIFSVWANGNNGPGCETSGSPGAITTRFSVGAYDVNNSIASFSSRGSGADGEIKPNIAAPGVNVRSVKAGSTDYVSANGTSMASPHVSGSIALLWSAAPDLVGDIAATRELLELTARDTEDLQCGGTAADNNVFGEGRIDVAALVANRRVGLLDGTVTGTDGAPIRADLQITGGADGSLDRRLTTGEQGTYRVALPAGDYLLQAVAYGFVGQERTVSIADDQTTTADFTLDAAPMVTVSGRITDGSGQGWPLYTALRFPGYPDNPVYTDPVTGEYSLQLPASADYDVQLEPVYDGYGTTRQNLTIGTADTTFDVALAADLDRCVAPGYGWNGTEGRFTRWTADEPRDGWSVAGRTGSWRFDNPGQRPQPGIDTQFAIAEPTGSPNKGVTTSLTTPGIDLTGQDDPTLTFDNRYLGAARQRATVEYAVGSGKWLPLWKAGEESVFGPQTVSLAAAKGRAGVKIRFTFSGRPGGYWAIDTVFAGTHTCVARPGGLVRGAVSAPDGTAVAGAEISLASDSEAGTYSQRFAQDAERSGAAQYWLFARAGQDTVAVARDGFQPLTQPVEVAAGTVTVLDLRLAPDA